MALRELEAATESGKDALELLRRNCPGPAHMRKRRTL